MKYYETGNRSVYLHTICIQYTPKRLSLFGGSTENVILSCGRGCMKLAHSLAIKHIFLHSEGYFERHLQNRRL